MFTKHERKAVDKDSGDLAQFFTFVFRKTQLFTLKKKKS